MLSSNPDGFGMEPRPDEVSDEIVMEFLEALEQSGTDYHVVQEWIKRYPDQADCLIELAYCHEVTDASSSLSSSDDVDEGVLDVGLRLLKERFSLSARIEGLFQTAKSRGLSQAELAKKLRVDIATLTRADRRLLSPTTIPAQFASLLADALGQALDSVVEYLRLKPRQSAQLSYKSDRPPTLTAGPQMSFKDSITCQQANPEDVKYWDVYLAQGDFVDSGKSER